MGNLVVIVSRLTCAVEMRFKYFWGGNYPCLGFRDVPNMLNDVPILKVVSDNFLTNENLLFRIQSN
jgi:hypothetical protein